MGRRPYTTTARFFKDSDLEIRIRWYPANPEDGTLPFPSRVCSLDWATEPYLHEGVGEVYGASRNYNSAKAVGPVGDPHVCGTADEFANGEHFDPDRPLNEYADNGLPTCCPHVHKATVRIAKKLVVSHVIKPPYYATAKIAKKLVVSHVIKPPYYATAKIAKKLVVSRVIDKPLYAVPKIAKKLVVSHTTTPPHQALALVAKKLVVSHLAETPDGAGCPALDLTCCGAPPGGLGQTCIYTFGPSTSDPNIRRWNVLVGERYRFVVSVGAETGWAWHLRQTTSCDSFIEITNGGVGDVTYDFLATLPNVCLFWERDLSRLVTAVSFSVQLAPLPHV